jgi:hypothetical protein
LPALSPGAALVAMVVSCNKCGEPEGARDAGRDAAPEATATSPSASDAGAPRDAAIADVEAVLHDAAPIDAGASACRLAYGPAEQPFRGPATIVPTPNLVQLVTNDSGKPRVYGVPVGPPPPAGAPPVTAPRPTSFTGVRWPPCEVANRVAYCQGPGGAIWRSALSGGGEAKQIAKARNGTRIAASPLGKDHTVVGWLESRRTTEGEMLQAFAAVDDGEPARLSDEGAGATQLRMVPRGEGALAVYIDTRTAMVPVHARPIAAKGSALVPGADEVIFVAGPPERGIDFAVAQGAGATFALLPTAKETTEFGMAALPIPDPPKHDVGALWSLYPNGLDPSPIGATVAVAGDKDADKGAIVARVRPLEKSVGAPRIVELGRIDAKGNFTSYGGIADGRRVTDIALSIDAFGAVWIVYGDTTATWLERRICP